MLARAHLLLDGLGLPVLPAQDADAVHLGAVHASGPPGRPHSVGVVSWPHRVDHDLLAVSSSR